MEELNNSNTFSSLVRIKNHQDMAKLQLNLTTEKFEDILEGELAKIGDLAKVWLCGPPNMAETVCSYFGKAYQNKDILLIVWSISLYLLNQTVWTLVSTLIYNLIAKLPMMRELCDCLCCDCWWMGLGPMGVSLHLFSCGCWSCQPF